MVRHEVDNEVVCCWRYDGRRDQWSKVVRILHNGPMGILGVESRKRIQGVKVLSVMRLVRVPESVSPHENQDCIDAWVTDLVMLEE